MDFDSYRAIPATNWSSLKNLRVSPLYYQHALKQEQGDAAHFRVGRAMHAFILEPELFRSEYVTYPGRRAGKEWNRFQDEHQDKCILSEAEYERAIGAGSALLAHPVAAQYLAAGFKEAVLRWSDALTGVECKARVDHCGTHLVDVKSTATIDPRKFARAVVDYGYHGQLAFYLDGLRRNSVIVDDTPILIAVQSAAPYDCIVYRVPEHVVNLGRDLYRDLLAKLCECRLTEEWHGIAPEEMELVLPEWAYGSGDPLELVIDGETVAL